MAKRWMCVSLLLCLLLTILPFTKVAQAHHVGIPGEPPVHEYITRQAVTLLEDLEEGNYSKKTAYPEMKRYLSGRGMYDLVTGSHDEDTVGDLPGDMFPVYGAAPFREHYWDPDGGISDGLYSFRSAAQRATDHWQLALSNYERGRFDVAYYYLGRACHLLQDMSVPAHAHDDDHAGYTREAGAPWLNAVDPSGGKDSYEQWVGTDGQHYTDYDSGDCSAPKYDDKWTLVGTSETNGYMWSLAERADNWDSDGVRGESEPLDVSALLADLSDEHCRRIANDLMPAAMAYTAGLMQHFYDSVKHVELTCLSKSKQADPGKDTFYDLELYNRGGIEDEFEVGYVVLEGDSSKWDISLHSFSNVGSKDKLAFQINPSNFASLFVKVRPHSDVKAGDDIKISITAKLKRAITGNPERDKHYTSEIQLVATNGHKANAVGLVIDVSGSMDGDPLRQAKYSASTFVGYLSESDKLAVVQFDDQYSVIYGMADVTASTKTGAQAAIAGAAGGGSTSIGGGLQTAAYALAAVSNDYAKPIILLTDGEENTEPYVADVKPDIIAQGIAIYSVGLGGASPEQLLALAQDTGGSFRFASDESSLRDIYSDFRRDISDLTNVFSQTGHINQGDRVSHSVSVDDSVSLLTVSVQYAGSDVDLSITDPSGRQIQATDPRVSRREQGPTYEFWDLKPSQAGSYAVTAVGVDIPAGGEDYLLEADVSSSMMTIINTDREEYVPGEWAKVTAFVLSDLEPLLNLSVAATISTSSGSENLTLYDDGQHGDKGANDGVYANLLRGTNMVGTHTIAATFTGQSAKGIAFVRKALTTFIVTPVDVLTVVISSPSEGAAYQRGQTVQLIGTACDPTSGALDRSLLSWSSSIDGNLGTGLELKTATLSEGRHTIELKVNTPAGDSATRTVSIVVGTEAATGSQKENGLSSWMLVAALATLAACLVLAAVAFRLMRKRPRLIAEPVPVQMPTVASGQTSLCPSCGTQLKPQAAYCHRCGVSVSKPEGGSPLDGGVPK